MDNSVAAQNMPCFMMNEPLFLKPIRCSYIWGTETWMISAHPSNPSVVENGHHKGQTLNKLAARCGAELMGEKAPAAFPLLIKVIDAKDKLSVQVHPNETTALLTGGEPKTEMWYLLGNEPDAVLYAGVKPDVTAETFRHALSGGSAADLLSMLPVAPGRALFIPGGLLHAIGAGCRIYEVQQSSNTTYRLFDWNRTDAQGTPRQLHIEEGFKAIDFALPVPTMIAKPEGALVSCPFFTLEKLVCPTPRELPGSRETFRALFIETGSAVLHCEAGNYSMSAGASVLLPAGLSARLIPDGTATVLSTTL